MSFVEPTKKFVRNPEYVKKLLNFELEKDLTEGEDICPNCGGTGLVIDNNVYGLSEDPQRHGLPLFRFKHQALSFCPTCYNGVVHYCKYCGNIVPRWKIRCDCRQSMDEWRAEINKKEQERMDAAPIATEEQIEKFGGWFYSEDFSYNDGFFNDWDEFFDDYMDELLSYPEGEKPPKPEFVWLAEAIPFHISAGDIVENALEDTYESAAVASESIKELQKILDDWCKSTGVGDTLTASNYKVRIPWEDICV